MSLRWSSYVAPKSPRGWLKNAKRRFSSKIALRLKKVCYKIYSCEKCQQQSCRAFIGLTIHAKKDWCGTSPFTWNLGSKWPRWRKIADFRSIFARSASAKKVQWSIIGSAFQWAQDEHRTLSLSPQRVAQKRNVSEIWTVTCDIS